MTVAHIRSGGETRRHTRRRSCDNRGRDWNDEFISKGMPRLVGKHHKLRERHWEIFLTSCKVEKFAIVIAQVTGSFLRCFYFGSSVFNPLKFCIPFHVVL